MASAVHLDERDACFGISLECIKVEDEENGVDRKADLKAEPGRTKGKAKQGKEPCVAKEANSHAKQRAGIDGGLGPTVSAATDEIEHA